MDDAPALFSDDALPAVSAVRTDPAMAALGARLPSTVYLGTSSWSFPGWQGLVYRGRHDPGTLSRHGLPAYAAHPCLRTVGVDRFWYAPATVDALAAYRDQVPPGFRFLVKAPAGVTRPETEDGRTSATFLDAAWASDHAVRPHVEGLDDRAGPLVFQFSPHAPGRHPGAHRFAERLHDFLRRLPRGPLYAVEVRDRDLLVPAYADALRDTSVVHCVNVFPGMPRVSTQARVAKAAGGGPVVVRWMLRPDLGYQQAKRQFAPFARLAAPHPEVRDEIADLLVATADLGLPAWVIANNKAEGSAPRSIEALASAFVGRLDERGRDGHGAS